MAIYSLSNIAEITGGRLEGETNISISQLLIDSRSTAVSSGSLFFAISGKQHEGHRYVSELYHRGVRAFVIAEMKESYRSMTGAGFVLVKDTLRALQELAHFHRNKFTVPVIAISGSNGKTIVKEWLYHCLSEKFRITRSPKSYNSQVGVPLSLWLMDEHTEMGIFEAGISLPGEMTRLQQMINPSVGIFTNIGEAHQENFRDIGQKITEKLRLFYGCHTLVYCCDHSIITGFIEKTPELSGVKLFAWSFQGKGEVNITEVRKNKDTTTFKACYRNHTLDISIPFADSASVENALHCLALMLYLEIDPERIPAR